MKTQVYGVRRGFLVETFLIFAAFVAVMVWNPCRAHAQSSPTAPPADGTPAVQPTQPALPAPPTDATTATDAADDDDTDDEVSDEDIDPDEAAVRSTRADVAQAIVKAKIQAQNRVLAQARLYLAQVIARDLELAEHLSGADGVSRDPADAVAENWGIVRLFNAFAAIEAYKIENVPAAARPLTDDDITGEEDTAAERATKRLEAKVEFASNDDRKVLFIAKSLGRLTGKVVSLAGLGEAPTKKPAAGKRRAVTKASPKGAPVKVVESDAPAADCAAICVNPSSEGCKTQCSAWMAAMNGGR